MKKTKLLLVGLIVGLAFTQMAVTSSSDSSYDPWLDLNDDGINDVNDLYILASIYGTSGTPINKTELILELQARIDSLNATLLNDYYNITDSDDRFVNVPGDTMTGTLSVTGAPYGVEGYGSIMGGYFKDTDGTGRAYLGYGDYGVLGHGSFAGGHFYDTDGTSRVYLGYGDYGIYQSLGATNYFAGDVGIGTTIPAARLHATGGSYGVQGDGSSWGGYFTDTDGTGYAYLGIGDYGVRGYGSFTGGYFEDTDGTGYALLGYGDTGIYAVGEYCGGTFTDSTSGSYSRLGYGDFGIYANAPKNYFYGNVGIGTLFPTEKLEVEGKVKAWGWITGDITFQKDGVNLWRMFEDEDGLYLENLRNGKVYGFVLQEVDSGKLLELGSGHFSITEGIIGFVIALGVVFGVTRYRAREKKEEIDAQQTKLSKWQ